MADILEVHQVLTRCGITAANTRQRIINNEDFTSLEAIGLMENDSDVNELAKRLSIVVF